MLLTGATTFLGAFLLFLVQPIIAKQLLPLFGGGAAVWATCLVFFQAALLLGYLYAHQLEQQLLRSTRPRTVAGVHLALLAASLLALPIVPSVAAAPAPSTAPAMQVLGLLLTTIGAPFVLLATTSPLLQAWLARQRTRHNPYRLFSVSNAASLAALAAYPFAIEPWVGTATQARVWSALYVVYVALAAWAAWRLGRPRAEAVAASDARAATPPARGAPARGSPIAWIVLAALGSYWLVAVTNHLTQNIPSVPLMWVLPLAVYLLSFILCFDNDRWYRASDGRVAALIALAAMTWLLVDPRLAGAMSLQTAVWITGLFVACMFCHGELALERPAASRLTHYYLSIAAGGALGGALVGLAAPALLPAYFEVEIGLALAAAVLLWRAWRRSAGWAVASAALAGSTGALAAYRIDSALDGVIAIGRNFHGVLRVHDSGQPDDPATWERLLIHGNIVHGQQQLAEPLRRRPGSYYTETSGIGRLLLARADRPLRVAVVGLGAGTIAAYGKPGDRYRFYELDPSVVRVARQHFSYLADSAAAVDIVLGDGRLALQREAAAPRVDVIAVDAFSGDSIPVHLLTREAVALYLERLAPDGVIALHISNRYLDLRPVVARIAEQLRLQLAYVEDAAGDDEPAKAASDWVLLARNRGVLDRAPIREGTRELPPLRPVRTWTDDYSNIAQVFRRRG